MDKFISKDSVMEIKSHEFFAEASSLGFSPGEWPEIMDTDIGNRQPFLRIGRDAEGGRIYQQAYGCVRLIVAND